MKKQKQRTKRARLHPDTLQLIKRISVGVLVLALVALLITGVWHGTRIPALTIQTVSVTGGETISHDLIRARTEAQLEGTYLRLIPRRFAYLFPHDDIAGALADIPRVRNLSIDRLSGTKLSVAFDEFVSEALWCGEGDCVFIDASGYAFAAAPSLQGGAFVRFGSERDPEVGQSVVVPSDYIAINELVDQLVAAGFDVESVTIDAARDAFLTLSNGGELRITLEQTPVETFDNFETVLSSDEFTGLEPGAFQYIDLRFGNKVFVNRTPPEIATTSEEVIIESGPKEIFEVDIVTEEEVGRETTIPVEESLATTSSTGT
jgi:cell division septal protein FtsQ